MIAEKKVDENIMEFNKKEFESFRVDVEKALQEVAKKNGVEIECGKICNAQVRKRNSSESVYDWIIASDFKITLYRYISDLYR